MIISKDDNLFVVKLYKDRMKDIDIYNIDDISRLFKDILVKLKIKYNIRGLCIIEVFVNEYYGMIIEADNEYKYGNDVDVKIKFHIDCLFMSEINNDDIDMCDDCYLYDNRYYTTYKELNDSEIIYKDCDRIIKDGIKIK